MQFNELQAANIINNTWMKILENNIFFITLG